MKKTLFSLLLAAVTALSFGQGSVVIKPAGAPSGGGITAEAVKDSIRKYVQDSFTVVQPPWIPVTTAHTLTRANPRVTVDASAGAVPITLPPLAEAAGADFYIDVINAANTVTLIGSIEGETNKALTTKQMVKLSADLTTWRIMQPGGGGGAIGSTDALPEGSTNLYHTAARVIAALPSQTGHAGKVLSTNGSALSWITQSSGGGGGGTDVSAWPNFKAVHSGPQWVSTASFQKIALETVTTDTHSGWDAVANEYTIPETGFYEIKMKLRLADGMAPGNSIGCGAGGTAEDAPHFIWRETGTYAAGQSGYRFTMLNARDDAFTAGQKVFLYAYIDDAVDNWGTRNVIAAELTIKRVR